MNKESVKEYLESIISSYETSHVGDNYRLIGISAKDVESLKIASDSVKKLNKIEKLVNEWEEDSKGFRDYMKEISEVIEDGNNN